MNRGIVDSGRGLRLSSCVGDAAVVCESECDMKLDGLRLLEIIRGDWWRVIFRTSAVSWMR